MKDSTYSQVETGFHALSQEVQGDISFTQKKYQAVMRQAQELLNHGSYHLADIHDSLNCGKLKKLFCYMRSGCSCLLLWGCYVEVITR